MNRARSLVGRRQFLVAAGVTSTAALARKKLAGLFVPGSLPAAAMASEDSGSGGKFSDRYRHLLSPLKIGNVILKNRMLYTKALPHYLQGPETFPADPVISHFSNMAKNGAGVVTVGISSFDLDDSGVQNYIAQIADAIHFYGAKANIALTQGREPSGYNISDITPDRNAPMERYRISEAKEMPVDMIQKMIDDFAALAKRYQDLGYDMANIYMSYRSSIFANSLSPAMNKRTDRYGGSLENRARLTIELCQAIKKACGKDFLIEAQISGEEEPGGYTLDDVVRFAKLWEGSVDILQLRGWDGTSSHPMGYNSKKGSPLTLPYAEAVKKSGAKIVTAPVGGFQDLDMNEAFIESGRTDMIAMARAFICDPEYGDKAYAGRGEDVVPCIRCNKCHGNAHAPHLDVCSVNPKLGLAHKIGRMVDPPGRPAKVAVIGGGPAGMKAAIVAAERGHQVTLYEKEPALGGLLRHTDFASFQWPLRDYKDYLIRRVEKSGIEVHLGTAVSPEMIKAGGYDAVLVAIGSEPVIPKIPGADGGNIYSVVDVYGKEKALGRKIVFAGSGLVAVQTGMHLAENGQRVTILASGKRLMEMEGPHQGIPTASYEDMDNFSFITEAIPTRISDRKVTYTDAKGGETSVDADSVVVYAGFKPKQEAAMAFSGAADRFFVIGDCDVVGNVQKCNRSAFAAASQI